MKGELKKIKRLQEQEERLKKFTGDFYQEKQIGSDWWVKSYNGATKRWQVAVYTEQSYRKYKNFQAQREPKRRKENIKPHKPFSRPSLSSIQELLKQKDEQDNFLRSI